MKYRYNAFKRIQSRAVSDFLFAICCLININDKAAKGFIGCCHFKTCMDPIKCNCAQAFSFSTIYVHLKTRGRLLKTKV